ncbi:transglutaminase-like cysteine peptidase [Paucibacter sp. APW11]|uniref:Transglutaminase-like cysteine peptidase n=1 Tax=Roseateles aquae TaxID=3077235 RepID=A0ABU3P8S3_9BURK|nr:transglutaminase-like cysteine peptidase [Paucibacter sp. APW11]MDT8998610.1 transglutaminase-like cysteine peptidase [Paucibacter sp. APW11]
MLLAAWLAQQPGLAWDVERVLEAAEQRGAKTLSQVQALRQLVERAASLDTPAKLALINNFFNQRVAYAEDTDAWGVIDYWASPLETLQKGRGDCEDYASAKYFSLLAAGVPGEQLRMVYVRAQLQGRSVAHMVLAHYASPEAEPTILDNLQTELRPASARRDLQPVFSFNAEGLWNGVAGSSAGNPVNRLSQWRDLLAKARAEGF